LKKLERLKSQVNLENKPVGKNIASDMLTKIARVVDGVSYGQKFTSSLATHNKLENYFLSCSARHKVAEIFKLRSYKIFSVQENNSQYYPMLLEAIMRIFAEFRRDYEIPQFAK
jgi:hypothetical protein